MLGGETVGRRKKAVPPVKLVKLSSLARLAYFRVHGKIEIDGTHSLLPSEFYQVVVKRAKGGAAIQVGVMSQAKLTSPTGRQYPFLLIPIERAKEADVEEIKH
jgi:hypothetical protein